MVKENANLDMLSLMHLQNLGMGVSNKKWDLRTEVWGTLANDGHRSNGRQQRVGDRHRRFTGCQEGVVREPSGGRRCAEKPL